MSQMPSPSPAPGQSDGLAIASLVCGIIGIVGTCIYGIGLLPAIAGAICGSLSKTPTGPRKAGLICSWVAIGINILAVIIVLLVVFGAFAVAAGGAAAGAGSNP